MSYSGVWEAGLAQVGDKPQKWGVGGVGGGLKV